jgi:ATP-binding cassette subfamily F protein 3
MLINLSDVSFGYGDKLILDGVTFSVNEGERVGLIGANGEGKTTLIKLITGENLPDAGEVMKKNGIRIGYLEQNGGYESGATVYEEMLSVFGEELAAIKRLNEISQKIAECDFSSKEYVKLSAKLEALQKYISAHECYDVEVKIKRVLNGMGFEKFYSQKVGTMSGGEKTRLKLCRLLLEEPDLLILDEPTNHLDIKTLFWLEDYLQEFKGAVFVVSHDRYFLDKIISRTLEIENKKLIPFSGNYSKYKILKEERNALLLKEYEKQQEEIKKLQTYVDKNIVRATTAKSAQSRVKQLDKMELKEKPYTPPKPPVFNFTYETPHYERVLQIDNLELEIGGKQLICGGQLTVMRGQKIAIVGENGAGKSTLLKAVADNHNPAITVGRYVNFAVYDQENANLNGDETVLQEMWNRHVAFSQTEVRSALARCGLFPEDMDKKVKELSGGERAKLALCVFAAEHGNVLLLDEPTNHLDLPARESLEKALKEFDGTVIFVSHDRYFISAIAGGIAEIEGGKLNYFEGSYDDYKQKKEEAARLKLQAEEEAARAAYEKSREASYRSRKDRAQEAQQKARIKQIEADISLCEQREAELSAQLADTSVTSDYRRLNEVLSQLDEIKKRVEELYAEYEKLL